MPLRAFVMCALFFNGSFGPNGGTTRIVEVLDGRWLPVTAELGGRPFPEDVRKSITLEIKDNAYTITVGAEGRDTGTLKVDATAQPRQMDIVGVEGPNKGRTILAIYEQDGDTLKICYDLTGAARPAEFRSPEGSQVFLVTYKRDAQVKH